MVTPSTTAAAQTISCALAQLLAVLPKANERVGRSLTFSFARIYIASLLLEQAQSDDQKDLFVLDHWIKRAPLVDPICLTADVDFFSTQRALVFAPAKL